MSFASLLTVLFIALKLTGYITWPWLYVLAPLWVGLLVGIIFVIAIFFIHLWDDRLKKAERAEKFKKLTAELYKRGE